MKAIHISPICNRESIMTHGIIPAKVTNPAHLESFKEQNLCTKDGKVIYTWQDSIDNEKFIKDMIFCKVWILYRNDIYTEGNELYEEYFYFDFRRVFNKNLCSYDSMTYDVYTIEVPNNHFDYFHGQIPSDDIFDTLWNMPEEYAHDHKRLIVLKVPATDLAIIGQAQFYYDNNKYHIKILK